MKVINIELTFFEMDELKKIAHSRKCSIAQVIKEFSLAYAHEKTI